VSWLAIRFFKVAGNFKLRSNGSVITLEIPLMKGDDLETVANTNVPPGRMAFRREVLNEEKRLMMLSTRRHSRANTVESWFSMDNSTISSVSKVPNGMGGLPPAVLNMFGGDGLRNVEEGVEENEDATTM
jgi:hypothetical protein